MRRRWALSFCLLAACGGEDASTGGGEGGGGADPGCPLGQLETEQGCVAFGVPEPCPEGFDWQDGACLPIQPAEPCPPGTVALLGEEICQPLAECEGDVWQKLPPGLAVTWVSASAGGFGDGSMANPYNSLQTAVDAAAPGSVVAVEAGTYAEDVVIFQHPVQLWGRCPTQVQITGGGTQIAPVIVANDVSGTSIHDVGVSGAGLGVAVSGSVDVTLSRLWIHDLPNIGVDVEDQLGATAVLLADSLVENVGRHGAFVFGASLTVERTVLRDVWPVAEAVPDGRGLTAENNPGTGARALVSLAQSLVQRSHDAGLAITGSDLVVTTSLVAGVFPTTTDPPRYGYGIATQAGLDGASSVATIDRSTVLGVREFGVYVSSSQAAITATSILEATPRDSGEFGDGAVAIGLPEVTRMAIAQSFLRGHARAGISAFGGVVELAGTTALCNPIDLDVEPDTLSAVDGQILDLGGNQCGCDGELGPCKVQSTMLQPPEPPL